MTEETHRIWDIIIKGLGFMATAFSFYFGLTQLTKQQHSAQELEARKAYWQRQIQVYGDICHIAGVMNENSADSESFEKSKKQFLEAYYGEIAMLEDSTVYNAMR